MNKGIKKAIIRNKELKQKRINDYNKEPKICLNCNKKIEYYKRYNKFCSKNCSASYNNRKRRISDETKEKISKKLKGRELSDSTKMKISLSNIKKYNSENGIEIKKNISLSLKKYWDNNEKAKKNLSLKLTGRKISSKTKEKLSIIMSEKIKNGLFVPKLKSITCFYKFKDKEIKCDSKVEYSCLDYFEKNYNVMNIERCDFLLDFKYEGINKKYNPDFKITTDKDIYIIECKTILSSKNLKRKWNYYYDTIKSKKESLKKYCIDNGFIDFNYNKSMNNYFYNNCNIE